MSKWSLLHEESPSGDVNIESWYSESAQGGHRLLFVRNNRCLNYTVYQSCEDVVGDNTDFALADVCYGWYNFLWESYGGKTSNAHNDFLDDCWVRSGASGIDGPFYCHKVPSMCDKELHAWQVYSDNEQCDGCDSCAKHMEHAAQVKL